MRKDIPILSLALALSLWLPFYIPAAVLALYLIRRV